jgi:hypothetical protein
MKNDWSRELREHLASYEDVDGLLPPSDQGCRRLEAHFAAIGLPVRVIVDAGEYLAEWNGRQTPLSLRPVPNR